MRACTHFANEALAHTPTIINTNTHADKLTINDHVPWCHDTLRKCPRIFAHVLDATHIRQTERERYRIYLFRSFATSDSKEMTISRGRARALTHKRLQSNQRTLRTCDARSIRTTASGFINLLTAMMREDPRRMREARTKNCLIDKHACHKCVRYSHFVCTLALTMNGLE